MEEWKRNLVFCWLGQFFSIMGFSFALPFAPYYLQELGVTDPAQLRFWTGLFGSATGLTMTFASPVWGYLADRWGRKLMTLRASLGGTIVLFGMGLATSPEMLLSFRLLQGVFTGMITAYLTLVVSNTPKRRMGLAIGLINSAVFCGNSLSPLLGGIFADLFGYRASFFVAAGLLFASFLISLLFVREQRVEPDPASKFSLLSDCKALLITGGVLPITGMVFLYAIALTIQRPQIPLLVRDVAVTDTNLATQAGFVIAVAGVASVLAGLIIGALTDRGRTTGLGVACALVGSLFVGAMIIAGRLWQLVLFNFLFAFNVGELDPILKTILTYVVPLEKRGSASGLLGSARAFGWFLGALSGGVLASLLGLHSVFMTSAALFILVAGLLVLQSNTTWKKGRQESK